MRHDAKKYKDIHFENEIRGIIKDAVAEIGASEGDPSPVITKALDEWTRSGNFDDMSVKSRTPPDSTSKLPLRNILIP
jgi:hypothetical protein